MGQNRVQKETHTFVDNWVFFEDVKMIQWVKDTLLYIPM
jgi:hypothetical protein